VRRLLALGLAFIVLGLLAFVAWTVPQGTTRLTDLVVDHAADFLEPPGPSGLPDRTFVIEPGESLNSVTQRLASEGIIRRPQVVRRVLRYYGVDRDVRAGKYTFPSDMTLRDLVEILQKGETELVRVTLVEGWRAEEVADQLERQGLAKRDDFLKLVYSPQPPPLVQGVLAPSLEGFLFPDTYLVPPNYGVKDFLDLVLENFKRRVQPAVQSNSGLSLYDSVVLASIVEREAKVPEERPVIAATYLNRLKDEFPIAADPTVQYALMPLMAQPRGGSYWRTELSSDDLKVASPYNTYVVKGLPPAPIANPGLASLQAVFQPDQVSYRYFVAKPDGSHAFATTFAQHLENQYLYQR
jgi:UPF0755 protein